MIRTLPGSSGKVDGNGWYWAVNWEGATTQFLASLEDGIWWGRDGHVLEGFDTGQVIRKAELETDDLGNPYYV